MKQKLLHLILALVTVVCAAQAHFVFVVPEAGGSSGKIFLSENLATDGAVEPALVSGAKLKLRASGGKETAIALTKAENAYSLAVTGSGTRVIHGVVDLGFTQAGSSAAKPYLLMYHPKAILGDAFDTGTKLGADVPVELIPSGKPGALRLVLVARGKPVANSEVTLILPDGSEEKAITDEHGRTKELTGSGRYGAWARFWEPASGERDGKKYQEVRHYATLVFDAQAEGPGGGASRSSAAARYPALPEAAASQGAVVSGGWLYVYGGHISRTHSYSTEAVSGKFHRLNLASPGGWEALPSGRAVQGMNIAAHGGKIYRVGGMEPRNPPGQPADNYSINEVTRYDPASGKWETLPPLPEPRSSHDVVVIGDELYVPAGWDMRGKDAGQEWGKTMFVMDLSAPALRWRSVAQPFERRALIATAHAGKLYVLGGIEPNGAVKGDVDIYDPKSGTWSKGPSLPGSGTNAFAPAAAVHGGKLYVSVADGKVYALDEKAGSWVLAGEASPRVAHRMVSWGDELLILGGAAGGKNLDSIEAVRAGK